MSADAVFALLDDGPATGAGPGGSRLYTGFVQLRRCTDPATLDAWWAAVQADLARGLHAVLLADYEWGARLQGSGGPTDPEAALRALLFTRLERLDDAGVQAWLRQQDGGAAEPTPAGPLGLTPDEDEDAFSATIAAIQRAIRDGETYQVNHTFCLHGQAHGRPVALYRRLRAHQPVAYGAFIALPDGGGPAGVTHVLSRSPELFLQHARGQLTARPMKGTAARQADPAQDQAAAQALRQDVKNRAENLMIVDLLRNDLGRVARTGSVRVPTLFAVEPYATVWQMTSTVQARLRPEVGLPALLRASFPCGSITGAPKHHTMALIRRFERAPRGLYCGAIGWLDAPAPDQPPGALGDFCLSVAIRTLTLGAPDAQGARALRLGVGAGIVQDSVAADEWAECRLKARFLSGLAPGFGLFETMLVPPTPPLDVAQRARHLARLGRSAAALGFAWDAAEASRQIDAALAELAATPPGAAGWRLRLALESDGRFSVRHAPLAALAVDGSGAVGIDLVTEPLAPSPLSAHKTTHRAPYDEAVREAEARGLFDRIFCGPDGQLIEGGRSSLFVRLAGQWCTPPVADGALPGICREIALAQGLWGEPVHERRLMRGDLARAEGLAVGNALRGVRAAWLAPSPAAGPT